MEVKIIKEYLINDQIRASEVRLVGVDGEQLGLKSLTEALALADEHGVDLVNISPTTSPPVCKLMDYGKYRFEEQKKEKDARKKQKATEVKGMELSMRIEEHDMLFKAKHVQKFLQSGEKVRVIIKKVRGRLAVYANQGIENMYKFHEMVKDFGDIEQKPTLTGTIITMILMPKNTK